LKESFEQQLNSTIVDVFSKGIRDVLSQLESSVEEMELEYSDRITKKRTMKEINIDNFQQVKD
jgi:hypothetical protein